MKERVALIGKVVLVLSLLVALFPSNVIADPFETAKSIAMNYGQYDKVVYIWKVTANESPLLRYSILYTPGGMVSMMIETAQKSDHLYRTESSSSFEGRFKYHRLTVQSVTFKTLESKDIDQQLAFEQANNFLNLVAPYMNLVPKRK